MVSFLKSASYTSILTDDAATLPQPHAARGGGGGKAAKPAVIGDSDLEATRATAGGTGLRHAGDAARNLRARHAERAGEIPKRAQGLILAKIVLLAITHVLQVAGKITLPTDESQRPQHHIND